jgi:hypothetical protein
VVEQSVRRDFCRASLNRVAAQEARAHADHQHNEADTVADGDGVAVRGDVNERVPIPMAHCAVGDGIDVQSGLDQREHQDVLTDSWPWPKEEPTEDRHDRHDIVQERIGDGGRSCNSTTRAARWSP